MTAGAAGGAWSAPAAGIGARLGSVAGRGGSGTGTLAAVPGEEAMEGEEGGVGARGPIVEKEEGGGDGGLLLPMEDMVRKGCLLGSFLA